MRYLVMFVLGAIGLSGMYFNQYPVIIGFGLLLLTGWIAISFGHGYCNTIEGLALTLKRHADKVRTAHANRSIELAREWNKPQEPQKTPQEAPMDLVMQKQKTVRLNGHA